MAALDHKLITTLLLGIFSFVLVMTMLAVFLVLQWRHRKTLTALDAEPEADSAPDLHRPSRAAFISRRPGCWLAVKSSNLSAVQSALSLHSPKPCSLADGLSGGDEQGLFISPPVAGWILIMGPALPDPADDVDLCHRFLLDFSRKLGHVQFFAANPMLNHHAWARIEAGRVLRAYAWAGKTLWNQGKPTTAEIAVRMQCYAYGEPAEARPFGGADTGVPNSEKVHLIAARWSLDPDQIDERFSSREWGVFGKVSRPF